MRVRTEDELNRLIAKQYEVQKRGYETKPGSPERRQNEQEWRKLDDEIEILQELLLEF